MGNALHKESESSSKESIIHQKEHEGHFLKDVDTQMYQQVYSI